MRRATRRAEEPSGPSEPSDPSICGLDSAPAPAYVPSTKLHLNKVLTTFKELKKKPRDIQVDALKQCIAHYNNGAEYVVLEAPPGTGKSYIAVALARAIGSTYVTTLTEQLQLQYEGDVRQLGARLLKGRGKYHCERAHASCRIGVQLLAGKCGKDCPYAQAKEAAFTSPLMIANYHSFLANVSQAGNYVEEGEGRDATDEAASLRDFLVCDETHLVEDFLLSTVGFTIDRMKLAVDTPLLPNEPTRSEPYVEWMRTAVPIITERIKQIVDPETKDELRVLLGKMHFSIREATATPMDFIPERGTDADGAFNPNWFALKPLRVNKYGSWLFKHARRQLFMSATVLNAGMLCSSLGLDPAKGDFVQMGSVFPKEHRPIVLYPMNMVKAARDETWPIMAGMIDKLLNHHANEKGLLLAPSNEMLKYVRSNISKRNAERLIFAYGEDRARKYAEHCNSKSPTVLAASGYWEGADLKDDNSRFQLIPAVPRPMWQGQIKARASIDPVWYRWLSYCKVVQGYGRSVRHESDTAITYIMDAEFEREMNRASGSMVPPWMKEAVRVVRPEADE